jgi:RND superfamily putative drug exporter
VIQNYTSWASVRFVSMELLSGTTGLPAQWLLTTWNEFPDSVPTPAAALAWANATVAGATLWTEPLPVPLSLRAPYVSPGVTAQLIVVSYAVSDGYTDSSGNSPVYSDINRINSLVPSIVRASDPSRSISFVQTGPSPLDQAQQTVVNAAIELVLPITVVVLVAITALYFRSPTTPLVAFAGLAVALVLGLGGTVLLGSLVTHVDTTSLTLEEVFVLGVGTDYSIFLISRYREELVAGADPREAMVTSVTWAGQSVATSGMTAVIATLALTFSGIALLSQWGMVLSFAVLMTILVSLTMIPALVTVLGPRIFWPYSGQRFRRLASRQRARAEQRSTYFYRVASFTRRRPLVIILVILVVTAPLVWVAFSVPISYDFYGQLPSSQPAVQGLNQLAKQFGDGFAFPTTALVTFASPILQGNHTNASEFASLAQLTSLAQNTSGVALVQSLVGPFGAPLATWQNLPAEPLVTQIHLEALAASLVGTDQRTVLVTVQMNQSGLSESAISTLNAVESSFAPYASTHPTIVQLAYVGGAPVTNDLATQAALATERLFIAVALALLIVLFVVLRSWIIPLLAVATIGLSIAWSWGLTYLVLGRLLAVPIFFFVPTLMFILILGLGIDYNIFLLSRVREERLRGRGSSDAVEEGLARTGGIITAAAVILAGAFGTLLAGDFSLLVAIGFSVAVAVILDAMVVRTYLVPSVLQVLGERVWRLPLRKQPSLAGAPAANPTPPSATAPRGP